MAGIDHLMGGGIERGTSTLIAGAAGSGKSTLAAQFVLAAAERGQRGAMFLFDESVNTLVSRCSGLNIDIQKHIDAGVVTAQQIDPAELCPGELTHAVAAAAERGASVIVIDSLNGYLNALPEERFLLIQLHELLTYLGERGVATIVIGAQRGLIGPNMVGLKAQVAAITESAMRGEIEYDESLRRRVAVLTDLDEQALQRVYDERVRLTPGAEKLLSAAQQKGLRTLLVSGGFTYVTDRLKERLKLDFTRSNCLEISNGKLTGQLVGDILNADGKRDALIEVRDRLGIDRDRIIGIGDGANDLKFMAECGVSVAYHAKPIVRGQTTHAINHVDLTGVIYLFH